MRTSPRDIETTPQVLDLQAPFRMGHETLPTGRNEKQRETHRKRPRDSSSVSSILEPLQHKGRGEHQHIYSSSDGYEQEGRSDSFESIVEGQSIPSLNGGEPPSEHQEQPKTYGRRPRRKTRPDLYDIKPPKGKENKKPRKERKQSRAGKQKRKRASLGLPKVSSEYVLTERLTVGSPWTLNI